MKLKSVKKESKVHQTQTWVSCFSIAYTSVLLVGNKVESKVWNRVGSEVFLLIFLPLEELLNKNNDSN